jgi:predicted dehydrogenase
MGAGHDTMDVSIDYFDGWREVTDVSAYKNPYRYGWEDFIAHVTADAPFQSTLLAGIRDVELSEACLNSAVNGEWVHMSTSLEDNR